MDAAEYKHVVLGLIFLKYISDAFEAQARRARGRAGAGRRPGGPGRVPRRQHLLGAAGGALVAPARPAPSSRRSAQLVDDAMAAIERDNPSLKGVLPKDYARPALDKQRLGQLIDLISNIALGDAAEPRQGHARPRLRVLPRPVRQRRGQEGRRSSTRRAASSACWSRCSRPTRAASTTPAAARAACSCRARSSSRRTAASSATSRIYGQESQLHHLAAGQDEPRHPRHRRARSPTATPSTTTATPTSRPTTSSPTRRSTTATGAASCCSDDKRWEYGVPPAGNANFAWVQHFIHHLAPTGHRRLRARQRLDVVEPVGRGRDPQGHHRGRPGGLHGRAAGPALLLDADPGLPLVPRARQEERPLPRPARRDAVHRRPQARHAWSTASTAS